MKQNIFELLEEIITERIATLSYYNLYYSNEIVVMQMKQSVIEEELDFLRYLNDSFKNE